MLVNPRGRQTLLASRHGDYSRLFKQAQYVSLSDGQFCGFLVMQTVDPVRMTRRGMISFSGEVTDADRSANSASPVKTPSARLVRTAFAISLLCEKLNRTISSDPDPRSMWGFFQDAIQLDLELI